MWCREVIVGMSSMNSGTVVRVLLSGGTNQIATTAVVTPVRVEGRAHAQPSARPFVTSPRFPSTVQSKYSFLICQPSASRDRRMVQCVGLYCKFGNSQVCFNLYLKKNQNAPRPYSSCCLYLTFLKVFSFSVVSEPTFGGKKKNSKFPIYTTVGATV